MRLWGAAIPVILMAAKIENARKCFNRVFIIGAVSKKGIACVLLNGYVTSSKRTIRLAAMGAPFYSTHNAWENTCRPWE
jgi:hypothetical protein